MYTNPDYPVDDGSNFIMHTYQQPQMQNTMYWNGSSFGPMGMQGFNDPASRRNLNPVNPFQQFGQQMPQQPNPFQQFGTNNNGAIPENMVQPFGTYPPSTPVGNQQQMGLNALIDAFCCGADSHIVFFSYSCILQRLTVDGKRVHQSLSLMEHAAESFFIWDYFTAVR